MVPLDRGGVAPRDILSLKEAARALAAESSRPDHYGVAELQSADQFIAFEFGKSDSPNQDGESVRVLTRIDHSFGSFCIHSSNPDRFTQEDVLFIESIGHLIAGTIESELLVKKLAKERNFSSSLMEVVDALVVVLTPQGRIVRFNRAGEKMTGYEQRDLEERFLVSAFAIPEEADLFRDTFAKLLAGENAVRLESHILTKHGERRRITWAFTSQRDDDGTVEFFLGTGIDITETCEAREQLRRAEAAAKRLKQSTESSSMAQDVGGGRLRIPDVAAGQRDAPQDRQKASKQTTEDRRRSPRYAYPCVQLVAPLIDGKIPDPKEFSEVRCREISTDGFGYLAPKAPDCKNLVVALGRHPSLIYVSASIRHVTPVKHQGCDMYLLGCEFGRRIGNAEAQCAAASEPVLAKG